jgi:hypothetical protein
VEVDFAGNRVVQTKLERRFTEQHKVAAHFCVLHLPSGGSLIVSSLVKTSAQWGSLGLAGSLLTKKIESLLSTHFATIKNMQRTLL